MTDFEILKEYGHCMEKSPHDFLFCSLKTGHQGNHKAMREHELENEVMAEWEQ